MKTLLTVIAVSAALLFSSLFVSATAFAADTYVCGLYSDGGNAGVTAPCTLGPKNKYSIQCRNDACYRVGAVGSTTAPTPNCTTDFRIYANGHRELEAGGALRLVVAAVDAGQPACNGFLLTSTPAQ